jgi:hypothetical protein
MRRTTLLSHAAPCQRLAHVLSAAAPIRAGEGCDGVHVFMNPREWSWRWALMGRGDLVAFRGSLEPPDLGASKCVFTPDNENRRLHLSPVCVR